MPAICDTGPAQHFITAGQDLDDLDREEPCNCFTSVAVTVSETV